MCPTTDEECTKVAKRSIPHFNQPPSCMPAVRTTPRCHFFSVQHTSANSVQIQVLNTGQAAHMHCQVSYMALATLYPKALWDQILNSLAGYHSSGDLASITHQSMYPDNAFTTLRSGLILVELKEAANCLPL